MVGLVTWYEDVVQLKQMGRSTVLPCSGWVAARHLRVRAREDYTAVPRVDLPEELKGFEPLTPRCDDTRRVQIAGPGSLAPAITHWGASNYVQGQLVEQDSVVACGIADGCSASATAGSFH